MTERARRRIILTGEVSIPVVPVTGCRFRTRCPKYANKLSEHERELCARERPALVDRGAGHEDACHYSEVIKVM